MSDANQKTGPDVPANHDDREAGTPKAAPSPGDIELIRWALSLTLEERLAVLHDFVDTFWTPQHG